MRLMNQYLISFVYWLLLGETRCLMVYGDKEQKVDEQDLNWANYGRWGPNFQDWEDEFAMQFWKDLAVQKREVGEQIEKEKSVNLAITRLHLWSLITYPKWSILNVMCFNWLNNKSIYIVIHF